MLAAGHHILLSHGLAAEVLRRDVPGARVGIAIDLNPVDPATDSEADRAAAWAADGENNRWFLDPILRAEYPADILERFAPAAPPVRDGDMATIAAAIDVLGVNYYTRRVVRAVDGGFADVYQDDSAHTDIGWEITPESFYKLLVRLRDEYAPPAISITENGAAFEDIQLHDGQVKDPERQAYIADHIAAVERAVEAGVPVEGYFVWSLLDNFEWARGLPEAVRDRLRRLPDARARAEGELLLVPRLHRRAPPGRRVRAAGDGADGEPVRRVRRRTAGVRDPPSGHAAAVAELPGPGRADRPLHQHRRRLHVLARRQAAPPDPLPLQQRARSTSAAATST